MRRFRGAFILVAGIVGLPHTQAAAAAPASSAPKPTDEIIITGSRIPRRNLTAVSPVTTIDDKEVKLEGAVLTETLINVLPQAKPDQGLYLSNGATGTATVDLRGFGPSRTLVLVNGRRLLPGDATYPAPDIDFIPTALIERVEVLTGGASSVYGSDAVAGVVNFILDTGIEGVRVDAQSSFYQHDNRAATLRPLLDAARFPYPQGNKVDGGIENVSAAVGQSFFGARAHVTLYGGYRHTQALTQESRDYSACSVAVDEPADDPACSGSPNSQPGTFFLSTLNQRYHATPARTFAPGLIFFNFAPFNYYQRPDRRYVLGGTAKFELSRSFQPYAEAMYMDDRTTAQIAPGGSFGIRFINCDNPLLSAQELGILCVNGNFVGQTLIKDNQGNIIGISGSPTIFTDATTSRTYMRASVSIARRNVEGGPRRDTSTHKDLRLVGGAKGELGRGLSYDASYLFSRVSQQRLHTNDLLLSRLRNALDVTTDPAGGAPICRAKLSGQDPSCIPWDIFAEGAASASAAAYLTVPSRLSGRVEERVANINITADLGQWGLRSPWADEAPALNVGGEYRKDQLSLDPDQHYRTADLGGLGSPILSLRGETSVKELFAEGRVPLVRNRLVEELTLEGGYRFSWHDNGTSRVSASSYKIGAEFSPIRGIRFRASQQRAVRAPNVQELFGETFATAFGIDPCAGPTPPATPQQCAASGVTGGQYGNIIIQPDPNQGYNAVTGGNANLKPERALTGTIGVVLQPQVLRGFTLSADWFDIRLARAIGFIGEQTILNTCIATGDPLFCARIHRDSEGSLWLSPQGYVDNTQANIGALKTSGVDVASSYRKRLGRFGSAGLQFQGTWTRRFVTDNGGLSKPYNCAGLYGVVCGFPLPRWRHNLRATWQSRRGPSLSILWRHMSAVPVDAKLTSTLYNSIVAEIPAQDYFDATATVRLGKAELRFGVRNVLDRQPPLVAGGDAGVCGNSGTCNGNTYPQLYDPLGRFVFAGATLAFGGR